MFIDGLDPRILGEVLCAPIPDTYQEIKQRAVDVTKVSLLVEAIHARRNQGNPQFTNQRNFQNTFGQNRPQHPFFQRNLAQPANNPNRPQYNSTNAPRWMNNIPVPMDIGRSQRGQNQNWRGWNQVNSAETWGTTATISPFRGSCYNCGKPGHMAKDCRAKKGNPSQAHIGYANVIMDEEEDMRGVQPSLQGDRTNQLAQMIASMSMDELNQTMNQVPARENQDFVGA